ncbi:unnamed protein product [Dibothriocephalus latus]|uniref:glutathione transferase n=1 Tax=Dibothriocephalus latus TaxID=60516 RepID=A0A3P7M976_DIBLA|nr:unnamed protein product [Dibothriocephalus latus]
MAPIQLGYWSIRGVHLQNRTYLNIFCLSQLAQPIRLLLEYVGEDYQEKRFGKGEFEEWKKIKYNLGIGFPNLPYIIDGDVKLAQSSVILRYLGEKHGLGGKGAKEQAEIAMAEAAIKDIRIAFGRIAYSSNYITYIDFLLYENLCVFQMFEPSTFKKHRNLKQYIERFEALPKIKEYMATERFISWPLNGWSASFGGGDAPPK